VSTGDRTAAAPVLPASDLLRVTVLVAALAAVAAVVAAGLAGVATGVLFAALVVCCAAAPVVMRSAAGVAGRKVASSTVVGLAVVAALLVDRPLEGGGAIASLPWELGPRLTLLAFGLLAAQMLVGDGQREVLVSLLAAAGLTVFALATDPGRGTGVALAVAWAAVITALAVARESSRRGSADAQARVLGAEPAAVAPGALAALVVGAAVVGVLAALLGPQPDGLQPRGGSFDGAGGTGGQVAGRETSAYTSGTLDLRARGSLPDTPVADVPADSPRLWLGATLTHYDGTTWRAPRAGFVLGPPLPGGPHHDLATDSWDIRTGTRKDRLETRDGFGGVLLAPGHAVGLDVRGTVLPISGGYFLEPSEETRRFPASYVVESTTTSPGADVLRAAAPHPAGQLPAPPEYLALPGTLPQRVRDLAHQLTEGATTRYDATVAVERYLQRTATYQLDSPVPPPGVDAVDHFLFTAHTGFCEQFASAEVVLLRAAGIPARLATGFSGGELDGATRTARASDAHAWVEVLYPGVGWAAADPTAGTRLSPAGGTLDRLQQLMRDAKGRAILAAIVVAASLLGAVLVWSLGRLVPALRRRRLARRRLAGLAPVQAAYLRLERALERTGAPRGGSESIGELGTRPELAPVAGALAVVERACYAAKPPTEQDSAAAARELDELVRQLLADA
jgi:hypothetical protein